MKKTLLFALITITAFSCRSAHPWDALNLPKGPGFVVLEDLSDLYNLPGVRVFKVKEGEHHRIIIDMGYDIETYHDDNCPNPIHQK